MNNTYLNPILSSSALTVCAKYEYQKSLNTQYQSEAALEESFINKLQQLSYEFLPLHKASDLKDNLRHQLEVLNNYSFSDSDWEEFYNTQISNSTKGIIEKTQFIQEKDPCITFKPSDGSEGKNIRFLFKDDIYKNKLQVIHQYEEDNGKRPNRYDVTILVNGLPLVHIELKRRGVAIREAFNQINRYGRESFWAGDSLFEYVQLFIISNGANTLYYSNTTRKNKTDGRCHTKGTFEFTSYWADQNNHPITELMDFTEYFLNKRTLLNVLTRYCVLDTRDTLLVLRPYQITAIEKILSKVNIDLHNPKLLGTSDAGGYIWHTTGSGKTLTSFKLAQLLTENKNIKKVLFIVDRKDLDYQTIQEYNRFQEGCVTSNKSTKALEHQINDNSDDSRIIVTTIQKLTSFIKKNEKNPIYNENVVLIFDECHRSQFGEMHSKIISHFKKYMIFGFTGTPIFSKNAKIEDGQVLTTDLIFGSRLHEYTITNAINDGKVLPFRIEYQNVIQKKENIEDSEVFAIDTKEALEAPERLKLISEYIVKHFDKKTHNKVYNSILACENTKVAAKYYELLKDKLKVGIIYSYNPNEEVEDLENDGINDEDIDGTENLDKSSRDLLESAIIDYNDRFKTSFNTGEQFSNYYKDISMRMKNKELDLLIVVNMFLTGFDAPCLNTLWVDKNLQYHGLLQAFSRTNRIKDSVKTFGNIICFRNLEEKVKEAIALFGDEKSSGVILLKPYEDYYKEYENMVLKLPKDISWLRGDKEKKLFISTFGKILILENILSAFDKFDEPGQKLISDYERENYRSKYLDLKDSISKRMQVEKESIMDDIVFQTELLKITDINYDYILELVQQYHDTNCSDKTIREKILHAIDGSIVLRSKKQLIEDFINNIENEKELINISEKWDSFFNKSKEEELNDIIKNENLYEDKTINFINGCFENNKISFTGDIISSLMIIKQSRFGKTNNETLNDRKNKLKEKLNNYFIKYNKGD